MRASGYERAEKDWYVEPRWCVDALLAAEKFNGRTWDPCCGSGNIPEAFEAAGVECIGTDICDRGYGAVLDFFASSVKVANIVSNPPYNRAEEFIHHALGIAAQKVAVLVRLAFLEGQKRRTFFATTPLARVLVSSRRISMPPGGTDVKASGGTVAYAWMIWDHAHTGPATVGWL